MSNHTPIRTVDLEPLRRVIDRGDLDALRVYLEGLPQRMKNGFLEAAGWRFGFLTAEVDGVVYMLAADLAQRLYRTSNTSALWELLRRQNQRLTSL
jgi:hypothetical protein